MGVKPTGFLNHLIQRELLRDPFSRGFTITGPEFVIVKQFVDSGCQGERIGGWNGYAGETVSRDERDPGIEASIDNRFTTCHCFELHNSKSLTAGDGGQDEEITRVEVRSQVFHELLAHKCDPIRHTAFGGKCSQPFPQRPISDDQRAPVYRAHGLNQIFESLVVNEAPHSQYKPGSIFTPHLGHRRFVAAHKLAGGHAKRDNVAKVAELAQDRRRVDVLWRGSNHGGASRQESR